MEVLVKAPFFDERGIHKKGEICEVKNFRPEYMEPVEDEKAEKKPITDKVIEEKKEKKAEKAVKTDSKKATRKG